MKRVMAHYMHAAERQAALEVMRDPETTESFVLGLVEEADIPRLEEQGLIVQILEDQPDVETPGTRGLPPEGPLPEAGPVMDEEGANFYLIQLSGPLLESCRRQLSELGVSLLEHIPHHSYTARLEPQQARQVRALDFVTSLRLYDDRDTGPLLFSPGTRQRSAVPARGQARPIITFDLRLHQAEDLQAVLEKLDAMGVSTAGGQGRKVRVYLLKDSDLLGRIIAMPEIASVEEYIPPELHNDIARQLMGVDAAAASGGTVISQTGEGEIVAVADTGIDLNHPDFQGRVVGVEALGRPNDPSDLHGHGTHVAGSILGDGSASGQQIQGTAPGAKLYFQSVMDASGQLSGLPLHLASLFGTAYQAGARIHNNSWGAATQSMYTFSSIEVDEFVDQHRDMLVVISAGNAGSALSPLHSQPGFVDWLSICSPASSKNALTVGASRSSRTNGGLSHLTYGMAWPQSYPDPPIRDETISGDCEAIAAFSSRGPCDDRRIKPDLVAPGTDILSTRASTAPLHNFWGPHPGNQHYAYMGGTSMSAPLVSGCAALVREYYARGLGHQPSAALIKATLINGTRLLSGPDALADHPYLPNYHQGFGAISMPHTLPNPSMPGMVLDFVDTWLAPDTQFHFTGQAFRFQFSTAEGPFLRICLAYSDVPGRALQNNLNLFVQHLGTGGKWIGNEALPTNLRIPDPDNNVEIFRMDDPPAGDWIVQVSAANLLRPGQDFALVVCGFLSSRMQTV